MLELQDEKYSATLPLDLRAWFEGSDASQEGLYPFTKKVFDIELEEHCKDIKEFGNIPNDERFWNRANSSGIGAPWSADDLEILLEMIDKANELLDVRREELWFALKDLEEEHDLPMEQFVEYKMFLIMQEHLSNDKKNLQKARPVVKRVYLNLRLMDSVGQEQALAHVQGGE